MSATPRRRASTRSTFRSGFSDENTKVRYAVQPGAISAAAGVR
ncbi:hypothetical protein [Massilia putida]|nr:hypothetical protein [Massilia putida]